MLGYLFACCVGYCVLTLVVVVLWYFISFRNAPLLTKDGKYQYPTKHGRRRR